MASAILLLCLKLTSGAIVTSQLCSSQADAAVGLAQRRCSRCAELNTCPAVWWP